MNPEYSLLDDVLVLTAAAATVCLLVIGFSRRIWADNLPLLASPPSPQQQRRQAVRRGWIMGTVYLVACGLWILFSDQLVAEIFSGEAEITFAQSVKELLFVTLNALLVGWLAVRGLRESAATSARLHLSETQFANVFDHSAVGMLMVGLDGQLLMVNAAFCQMLGHSRGELLGRPFIELTHADDRGLCVSEVSALACGKTDRLKLQKRYLKKDGGFIWATVVGSLVRDGDGQPQFLVGQVEDISSWKAAEAGLRESEQKFRLLVEQSLVGVYIIQDNRFAYVNPRFAEIAGYKPEEIIGRLAVNDLIHEPDIPLVTRNIQRRIEGEAQVAHYHFRERRKDGSLVHVEVLGSRTDFNGRAAIIGTLLDVTRQKKAEDDLRQSEQRFRALFENFPDAIFVEDVDGRVLDVNAAACWLHGLPREKLVGRNVSELVPPELRAKVATEFPRLVSGEVNKVESLSFTADGRSVPVELTVSRVFHDGQPTLLLNARDLSDRKAVESALRESETRFRQIADNVQEVFWLASADLKQFIYASPAYEKIWGATAENLYANPDTWLGAIHAEDRDRVARALRSLALGGDYDESFRIVRPDGTTRWIHDRAFPVHDQLDAVYRLAGVAQDITEQRELEGQNRQMQKLDSLGRITAGIAHDFNNMLAVIQGHTDQLLLDKRRSPDAERSLQQILDASRRAANLTRQLLTFSRKQTMRPETSDLNETITNLVKMLRRVLGEHVTLTTATRVHPAFIRADVSMMEQVLLNLAVNARDAMPDGGKLHIETSLVEVDTNFLKRTAEAVGGEHICLAVTDTGCGIAPEILPRIFEPFFTTKSPDRGTGLGLSTVYGIIKQHNGWVEVESAPGNGATFKIFLPVAKDLPPKPAPGGAASLPPANGSETILIVEDESAVLQVAVAILRSRGYRVLEATTGPEAMEVAANSAQPIDLLITDMVLPGGMTGREIAQKLRALRPGIKVIFTSGYPDNSAENLAESLFLPKPFDAQRLADATRRSLSLN